MSSAAVHQYPARPSSPSGRRSSSHAQATAHTAERIRAATAAAQGAAPTRSGYVATSTPASKPQDGYYGQEEIAKLCARYIGQTFGCPENPQPASSSPQTPTPLLALFVAYALHRTRLHQCVTFTALFLLSRLKNRFPAARGSSGHRLFISAFMIASKVVCDDTYSNKSWCVVGQGMFTLREINQMEREMCGYLEWQLNFDPADLAEFEARVRKEYGPGGAGQRPIYVSSASTASAATTKTVVAAPAPLALASSRPVVPPINTNMASRRYPASPPASPALDTPTSSLSADSSPESATCLTPPSDDARDTTAVAHQASRHAVYNKTVANLASGVAAASIVSTAAHKGEQPFQPFASAAVW